MKRLFAIILFLSPGNHLYAEDITTTSGTQYTNVTIRRVLPDGLVIDTESGVEKIPFAILPKELQIKYGYAPQKAAKYNEAVRAAAAQRQAALETIKQQKAEEAKNAADSEALDKATVAVSGKVISVSSKGVLLSEAAIAMPMIKNVVVERSPLTGAVTYAPKQVMETVTSEEPIFIYGVTGFVDGEMFSGKVYPAPNFSYTSVIGAAKAVRAFAVSKALSKMLLQNGR